MTEKQKLAKRALALYRAAKHNMLDKGFKEAFGKSNGYFNHTENFKDDWLTHYDFIHGELYKWGVGCIVFSVKITLQIREYATTHGDVCADGLRII